jgi:hypothetical protein
MFDSYCIPNIPHIPDEKWCKGCQCMHPVEDFNNARKLTGRGEHFCKVWKKLKKWERNQSNKKKAA